MALIVSSRSKFETGSFAGGFHPDPLRMYNLVAIYVADRSRKQKREKSMSNDRHVNYIGWIHTDVRRADPKHSANYGLNACGPKPLKS